MLFAKAVRSSLLCVASTTSEKRGSALHTLKCEMSKPRSCTVVSVKLVTERIASLHIVMYTPSVHQSCVNQEWL